MTRPILTREEPVDLDTLDDVDFRMMAATVPAVTPARRASSLHAQSFEKYRAIEGVNWSSLKNLYVDRAPPTESRLCITSPYRYQYWKQRGDVFETPAMRLGRAVHTAVFESDRLPLEYVVCSCTNKNLKAHRLCKQQATGKTLLGEAEYDKAIAIRDAIRANPNAAAYLARGEAEKTIVWTDKATGLRCKGRLDFFSHAFPAVVDLKTTNDIGERAFRAQAEKMGYFRQLAMYTAGAVAADLLVVPRAVIIAVENRPPYEVAVYPIEADALATAGEEVAELLATLKDCLASDSWPPRYTTEQVLARPAWVSGDDISIGFEE
jgi:hypothetical protein